MKSLAVDFNILFQFLQVLNQYLTTKLRQFPHLAKSIVLAFQLGVFFVFLRVIRINAPKNKMAAKNSDTEKLSTMP